MYIPKAKKRKTIPKYFQKGLKLRQETTKSNYLRSNLGHAVYLGRLLGSKSADPSRESRLGKKGFDPLVQDGKSRYMQDRCSSIGRLK